MTGFFASNPGPEEPIFQNPVQTEKTAQSGTEWLAANHAKSNNQ
jgi:hypothetical protein